MLDRRDIRLNHSSNQNGMDEIYKVSRRQDAMCTFLFGKTLNGEGAMNLEPTRDSWCGQIKAQVDKIPGLEKRMLYGTGFIVGAGFVINQLSKYIKW